MWSASCHASSTALLQERRARYNKLSGPEKATLNLVSTVTDHLQ